MYSKAAQTKTMPTEIEHPEKLEDMSDKELLNLHDGIIDIRCYLDRKLAKITAIMHERLEKNLVK